MELRLTVPDRRSPGHFNVVCSVVFACVGRERGKEGHWGMGKGPKSGAVNSEHVASKGRSLQLCTKSYHSK